MNVTLESILWGYVEASRLILLALDSGSYQVAIENEEQHRFKVVDAAGIPLRFPSQSEVLRQFHGLAILDIQTERYRPADKTISLQWPDADSGTVIA